MMSSGTDLIPSCDIIAWVTQELWLSRDNEVITGGWPCCASPPWGVISWVQSSDVITEQHL